MTEYTLPHQVASPRDEYFDSIVEYLEKQGIVEEDVVVQELEMSVDPKAVTVSDLKVEVTPSSSND
jgi:hypothetical protein